MEKLSLTGKSKHVVDDQMKGLSALFIDGDRIFIDNGAIHAKSQIEQGIQFVRDRAQVPNGRTILGIWITLHRFEHGQGFYGAMPFELFIDENAKVGHKYLSQQVNGMDKAVRGQVQLTEMPIQIRLKVRQYLEQVRPDLWEHAAETFKAAFTEENDRKIATSEVVSDESGA